MHPADDVNALLKARAKIDEQLRRHKNALTVLFTDVVGSTSYFERNGDTAGLVMIHRHDELAACAIQQHEGKVIKTIGDSAMAEFQNPATAVPETQSDIAGRSTRAGSDWDSLRAGFPQGQ
jgi:class 3 adenylate cyclase